MIIGGGSVDSGGSISVPAQEFSSEPGQVIMGVPHRSNNPTVYMVSASVNDKESLMVNSVRTQ
jgi:hypothetical protein